MGISKCQGRYHITQKFEDFTKPVKTRSALLETKKKFTQNFGNIICCHNGSYSWPYLLLLILHQYEDFKSTVEAPTYGSIDK